MKFGKWILNNFALKAIALILAVTTWFYVFNEIESKNVKKYPKAELLPSYGKMVSKRMFVKAIFIGKPEEGYIVNVDALKFEPHFFLVAGPEAVLSKVEELKTEPIDISRFKKTTVYHAGISSLAPGIDTEKLTVDITIPVKKISDQLNGEKK